MGKSKSVLGPQRDGSLYPLASCIPFCTGYTICYFPQAMSQMLDNRDVDLLLRSKQPAPALPDHSPQVQLSILRPFQR